MEKRFLSVIAILFSIFASTPYPAVAVDTPPDAVKKAAAKGLSMFVKDPRIQHLTQIGLNTQQEIDNAELGEGFLMYGVSAKIFGDSATQDLAASVQPTNQWNFLVRSGGEAKALIRVDFADGEWRPISIGASTLAKEVSSFLAKWPDVDGYHFRFIRVYKATMDVVEVTRNGRLRGFVPLSSLIMMPGRARGTFTEGDLHDSGEILDRLRSAAKQAMSHLPKQL